ncbi:hypothetical protein ACFW9X_23110 [Streptomyces sp. NPDC059466]
MQHEQDALENQPVCTPAIVLALLGTPNEMIFAMVGSGSAEAVGS